MANSHDPCLYKGKGFYQLREIVRTILIFHFSNLSPTLFLAGLRNPRGFGLSLLVHDVVRQRSLRLGFIVYWRRLHGYPVHTRFSRIGGCAYRLKYSNNVTRLGASLHSTPCLSSSIDFDDFAPRSHLLKEWFWDF